MGQRIARKFFVLGLFALLALALSNAGAVAVAQSQGQGEGHCPMQKSMAADAEHSAQSAQSAQAMPPAGAPGPRMDRDRGEAGPFARLGLSDEQHEAIKQLREHGEQVRVQLRKELMRAENELRGEMLKDDPNAPRARELAQQIGNIQTQMHIQRLEQQIAFRKVLTPQQRDQLLSREPSEGRGRHRDRMQGMRGGPGCCGRGAAMGTMGGPMGCCRMGGSQPGCMMGPQGDASGKSGAQGGPGCMMQGGPGCMMGAQRGHGCMMQGGPGCMMGQQGGAGCMMGPQGGAGCMMGPQCCPGGTLPPGCGMMQGQAWPDSDSDDEDDEEGAELFW
jgi:Spy/CpxP family protein refolding chaperone